MITRFIGDIHGQYPQYIKAIGDSKNTIQIGDFGFGFGTLGKASYIDEMIKSIPGTHRMIRGNHDSLQEAKKSSNFIEDGIIETYGNTKVMYVGGAYSIDQHWRTEGKDYWSDEELSVRELDEIILKWCDIKPDIMVAHECPNFIANDYLIPSVNGQNIGSRTRDAFEHMFAIHQPKFHIFGHWHHSLDYIHGNTRFICLNINETFDINLETLEIVVNM